ncbi:protein adenylyltransferase SelO [Bombella saccharophila]|uniref:Protein nucleotidyltransferase YdiU n=1 Tax=Bombella saccharophila TaxID=2967338 RepID=A0ABT3W8T1_9PROT|nr:YdiU family protein [Bombella saccharophila]MCX5615218.1 YdiU family protein [Bombella saccharophila]
MFSPSLYATTLSEFFYKPISLAAPPAPHLVALNIPLAQTLGLDVDWLHSPAGITSLCQGRLPTDHIEAPHTNPVASVYAGHQFGHFVPSLGDGRAALIADCQDQNGTMMELQIKGSGPTPFSRGGDGKNTLGPALREYIVSEAMHALNIPTTRALAVLTTGEVIERDNGPVPGAMIIRAARSHIRVGSFQYAAAHGGLERVRELADFTIQRLFPHLAKEVGPARYRAFFMAVIKKQAALIAQWMEVGFIHGVMNTDNCALSGETLDYGPCAFMDRFDPMKHFSFIDKEGRYAYGRQPSLALWNLSRLAECLFPLFDEDEHRAIEQAQEALHEFDHLFHHQWLSGFRRKLGLEKQDEHDIRLLEHLLETMHTGQADFTNTFRMLSSAPVALEGQYDVLRDLFPANKGHFDLCRTELLHRLTLEERSPEARQKAMQATNPRIIPRNHQVEATLSHALKGDYQPFHMLHEALKSPFTEAEDALAAPPLPEEEVRYTFCGT